MEVEGVFFLLIWNVASEETPSFNHVALVKVLRRYQVQLVVEQVLVLITSSLRTDDVHLVVDVHVQTDFSVLASEPATKKKHGFNFFSFKHGLEFLDSIIEQSLSE